MYIVSACLLGENCKYNGKNNETPWVVEFEKYNSCIRVCPERAGGLPCPRPPAEIVSGRVIDKNGNDITEEFYKGAKMSFDAAKSMEENHGEGIVCALLKANSPSCGAGRIYDGSFSGVKTDGNGVFAELLMKNGIRVFGENDEEEFKSFTELYIGKE